LSHVLDTNVALYHLSGKLADPLPSGPLLVSIVTEIELLAFKSLTASERSAINALLSGMTIIDLDCSIKGEAIRMRLSGLRLPDAVVAATALIHGAELLTHDAKLLQAPGIVAWAPALK